MQRKEHVSPVIVTSLTLMFALSLAVCAKAQTVTTLAKFNGTNEWQPFGPVVQATDGNFYGTTAFGGLGYGNVYRMTPSGKITSIYSFCSQPNCADGETPITAPILGSDGNLYGVTWNGGKGISGAEAGAFYKLTLNGKITILRSFCSSDGCTDGSTPTGVILASDGNFYGTTNYGGTAGYGTIFSISPSGAYKVLYSFCSQANCVDGAYVGFPPIQGRDGNFYGVTDGGGTESGGVLYKLTASGTYQVLHNFCLNGSCLEGSIPNNLVQDAKGNFFGTTLGGGSLLAGTGFEYTATGTYKVVHNFSSGVGEAQSLTLASDGNLYGLTGGGSPFDGGDGVGSIFEITPAGKFTSLYTFCDCGNPTNGYNPEGTLFQGTDGNFYGTTMFGGTSGQNFGTVFKLSEGLAPLVETVPVAGNVGQSVIILGNALKGSTSVTFNGKAASFTVVSNSEIKATVPSGATTGTVSVVTPTGTLNSNPQFVVTK